MRTFKVTLDPMEQLERIRTNVSMEAISMAGISNAFSNMLPAVRDFFDSLTNNFSATEQPIVLTSNEQNFINLLKGRSYLNINNLGAYVPEGLNSTYLEYLNVLEDTVKHVEKYAMTSVNEYTILVSQLVTNRNAKYSMPADRAKHDALEKERHDLNTRLGACFQNGSSKVDVNYGDVVSRNADWPAVFVAMTSVSSIINKIHRTDMQRKAHECAKLLDSVIKQVNNDEFNGAAPEVVNNLANGAFQVAAELEFYAVTYYKIAALANAINDTVKHVTETLTAEATA